MAKSTTNRSASITIAGILIAAAVSCIISIILLIWGLVHEGPTFYNGQECRMTYSHFQFLPLRVLPSPTKSKVDDNIQQQLEEERYRLLKFTDKRDPRHEHFYPISGSLVENYESASHNPNNKKSSNSKDDETGRLLDFTDNWCLLPNDMIENSSNSNTNNKWKDVPHPHKGHPVLYVPGHWGSFSQARSIGAHGTRWTGPYKKSVSDREIYNSLSSGSGMHNGHDIYNTTHPSNLDEFMNLWFTSSSSQLKHQQSLDEFVMDVYTLDFNEQGAALHASILLHQAEYFTRAIETIVTGCHISNSTKNNSSHGGITIVAHSIGAWVVRIALKMHPHLIGNGWIRNVITLASPLGSIPYAVDTGVHDIVKHINDFDDEHNNKVSSDVTMISISGGLRDEMIPPEVCQAPSDSTNQHDGVGSSNTFLATHIKQNKDNLVAGDKFGMDHRAIVWCYDLLTVVREVIFSLVVATDHGLDSTERLKIAHKVMYEDVEHEHTIHKGEESSTKYQEVVTKQHARLLQMKGYARTVSIQLAAPYNLNSLLKLCIVAALLHTFAMVPLMQYLCKESTDTISEKLISMATSLLVIPAMLVIMTWIRQLIQVCNGYECNILLGTVYILAQLATLIHLLIVYGICTIVASTCRKCFTKQKGTTKKKKKTSSTSFRKTFVQLCSRLLLILVFAALPLTIVTCYTINTIILGNNDTAWNMTAMASYGFISLVLFNILKLVITACKPSSVITEQYRSELFILLLSLLSATFGKVLYAFSLTTKYGQRDLGSYDNFLTAMGSNIGVIGGHHNEMLGCVLTLLLPITMMLMFIRTYETMSSQADNGNRFIDILNNAKLRYKEPKVITIVRACLTCWLTWNVLANLSSDNLIIPIYSSIMIVTTYLRWNFYSNGVTSACSAIIDNDLSLHCESPKYHDKNK